MRRRQTDYGTIILHWLLVAAFGVAFVRDRKSTRLNSSHQIISYAVFCLKKKTNTRPTTIQSPIRSPTTDTVSVLQQTLCRRAPSFTNTPADSHALRLGFKCNLYLITCRR